MWSLVHTTKPLQYLQSLLEGPRAGTGVGEGCRSGVRSCVWGAQDWKSRGSAGQAQGISIAVGGRGRNPASAELQWLIDMGNAFTESFPPVRLAFAHTASL